jgi:hypothetical protein
MGMVYFDIFNAAESQVAKPAHCLRITKMAAILVAAHSEAARDDYWTRLGVIRFNDKGAHWWEGCEEKVLTIL